MRVLLTGGGTAGHINPAIAIADYIKEKEPGSEFLFIGTTYGLEKNLVPKKGYKIKYIEVMGLRRSLSTENIKVALKYVKSIVCSKKIIKQFAPDVVVGTGGYVCAPVIRAASSLGIPTIIHEQNVFPGLAIKMLSQKADITAISFEETRNMMKAKKMLLTGNPLRPDLFEKQGEDIRKLFGFDEKPVVLMFGGSLGAEKMNDALVDMLADSPEGFNLIAATGEKHFETVKARLAENNTDIDKMKNIAVLPYIYNMGEIIGQADVIVGRAGAITVSEIAALGKAAILIPSPYVAHNHQEYNARYLEKNGAAYVITEKELSGKKLLCEINNIISDEAKLDKMRECSKKMGICDACDTIYRSICEIRRR